MVSVQLKQIGPVKFECINSLGKSCVIDGPASIGGGEDGLRPMELLLMGLAGCSSFDVLNILRKQRQEIEDLQVDVEGDRADATPAVYTDILLKFTAKGKVDPNKLQKAIEISVEKYCSAAAMLSKTAQIRFEFKVVD